MTDYKDHPVSIAEARAYKDSDGRKWAARDMFINLLRDIDNGRDIDTAIVCYRYGKTDDDSGTVTYAWAGSDVLSALGVWLLGKEVMVNKGEE